MALQTRKLVMIGLGIQDDSSPNPAQPTPLLNGVHLRWAFSPELGFPWHGFYLFRRPHKPGIQTCLSNALRNVRPGSTMGATFDISTFGRISSDRDLVVTDDFAPKGLVEFNLRTRQHLRIDLLPGNFTGHVEFQIGFLETSVIRVTGLFENLPVARARIKGERGEIVSTVMEADGISAIELSSGPAVLVDLCIESVETTRRWESLSDFHYPLCLPIAHPDYPGTGGRSEDLAASRSVARGRIKYGDSAQIVGAPVPTPSVGTVTVVNGSPIVIGHGTAWEAALSGAILRVDGDPTGYAIQTVVSPERLVLSRDYTGTLRPGQPYSINQDPFGQLHDYLIHLIAGGSAGDPMDRRVLPHSIYTAGMVTATTGVSSVVGTRTSWGPELVGLALQLYAANGGTIEVDQGSSMVRGNGTAWDSSLVGLTLQVMSERATYTISSVEPARQLLWLDKPYAGDTCVGLTYTIPENRSYIITDVVSPTELKLDRPYSREAEPGSTYSRSYRIGPAPHAAPSATGAPTMPRQYPLDMVLLASLHPAFAQMLGLYWIDQAVVAGQSFDYLILADQDGRLGGDPASALRTLAATGFSDIDGYIVFNQKVETIPSLTPPVDVRVYALPGLTINPQSPEGSDATPVDAPNNAGLYWDLDSEIPEAPLSQTVMYHVWRAVLGDEALPAAPLNYTLLTRDHPVLVSRPPLAVGRPEPPPDWPPFPLHVTDRGLSDGWYAYQTSGIDIFGRHSVNSAPAMWRQWTPPPDPQPWYYQAELADGAVHPSAVRLLDKIGPPPPTDIEATALDPADPMVLQDEAYQSWRTAHPDVVGLRLRWLWTQAHRQLAPDTREFRIYYQPGHINAVLGNTRRVSLISDTESDVKTDIANNQPVNTYVGAALRIGSDAFKVLSSEAGSPLRLRVRHLGPVHTAGTVEVRLGSRAVTGSGTAWSAELAGLTLCLPGETSGYPIERVDSPTQLILDEAYAGASGTGRAYALASALPRANAPCTLALPPIYTAGSIAVTDGTATVAGTDTYWTAHLTGSLLTIDGGQTEYRVLRVDSSSQLTLDRAYSGRSGGERRYAIRHPLVVDYSAPTAWQQRIHVVGFDEQIAETLQPAQAENGQVLQGASARVDGSVVTLVGGPETLPDLSDLQLGEAPLLTPYLFLERDSRRRTRMYRITAVNNVAKTVTVDGAPDTGGTLSAWAIGWLVRQYEVFLPAPDVSAGRPFAPSLQDPIVYARIGVSAADAKAHTSDASRWAGTRWGGRAGNEGSVGAQSTVFRVLRERPPRPSVPPDSERVFATPADYHGRSFYTYRWQPTAHLKTHIFRALDDSVFKTDRLIRSTRSRLDPALPWHADYFPRADTGGAPWPVERKQAVARQLNGLNSFDRYAELSSDEQAVLARLPGNQGVSWDHGLQERDWAIRASRRSLTPSGSTGSYFPPEWDEAKRQAVATPLNAVTTTMLLAGTAATAAQAVVTLDGAPDLTRVQPYRDTLWLAADTPPTGQRYGITAVDNAAHSVTLDGVPNLSGRPSAWVIDVDVYRALSNDALRVLAGLPGNEAAFTQVTIQPLDPDDPATANRVGPDNPADFPVDSALRIYIDTLDGRATNRYFYRATYVDGAYNRSEPSLASPPASLPDVIPPRTPIITRVLGGDRQITLQWASGREPDLREYHVYRTDDQDHARDVRLMTLVETISVSATQPAHERPAEVAWTDMDVRALVTIYYRVLAVAGEVDIAVTHRLSEPSAVITARAFDDLCPEPPEWRVQMPGPEPTSVRLSWSSQPANLHYLVQRRLPSAREWENISGWLSPDTPQFVDAERIPGRRYVYRLRVLNEAGKTNKRFNEQIA